MMTEIMNREIHLRKRPDGIPQETDFEIVEVPVGRLVDGEILVRNLYLSVDPYMRGRMRDAKSYAAAFELGEALTGGCVGQVLESKSEAFQPGDFVLGYQGWRTHFKSIAEGLTKIDPDDVPVQSYLGAMGMPGMTAYGGLLEIGRPKQGETVYVSAAAGAVGSIVCQIAKIKGCRVVGSAGSDKKIAWLLEKAGVDAAFNYKKVSDLTAELKTHCPDGIDVYFENVGGKHLEAALANMNMHGRIPVCGMISQYNQLDAQSGPRNLAVMIGKRLLLQGFIVSDYYDQRPQFYADMKGWIKEGRMVWEETIVEGIENMPRAFIGLFSGDNLGKMLVQVGKALG